jgi:hypothetical protein
MIKSFTDYTGKILNDLIIEGTIEGSCFSQEKPNSVIFPYDMQNITFIRCNLDNVFIPDGNTVIGGSQRRFMAFDDGYDWLVDENNNLISRLDGGI